MSNPDTWLQDGPLLYRVTDDRHPVNRDEINVTMADGSRDLGARTKRASEILALLAPTEAAAMAATVPAGWKPAPHQATAHMVEEGCRAWRANAGMPLSTQIAVAYGRMLIVAPQAPVAGQPALSDIAEALDLDASATRRDIITAIGDMRARLYDAEEALLADQPAEPSPAACVPEPKDERDAWSSWSMSYNNGWNDCRKAMLANLAAPKGDSNG